MYVAGIAIVAASVAVWSGRAAAHAHPASEEPKAGATLTAAPDRVAIVFDDDLESLFAKLDVVNAAGGNEDAQSPVVGSDARTLSVRLKPLAPGIYKVEWGVVAKDSHRTQGSYNFTVAPASK